MLLCGSATPRPESWHRAAAARAARARRRPCGCRRSSCSTCAACATRCTRARARRSTRSSASGGKAIVLVNRRGWSPFVVCRACGQAWTCPRCDVTLTLHRDGARAGAAAATTAATREPVPSPAPSAARRAVARHGTGTQRLEAELARGARAAAGVPARQRRGPAQGRHRRACCDASTRVRPASWSARRWSRRATTSPRCRWRSCRTPTRRFGSPTSAPRSARSRSSRSSPAAAAAAPRGGRVLVQTLCPEAALPSPRRAPRRRGLPRGGAASGAARSAIRRSPSCPGRHVGRRRRPPRTRGRERRRRARRAAGLASARPGAALPAQGPLSAACC